MIRTYYIAILIITILSCTSPVTETNNSPVIQDKESSLMEINTIDEPIEEICDVKRIYR